MEEGQTYMGNAGINHLTLSAGLLKRLTDFKKEINIE